MSATITVTGIKHDIREMTYSQTISLSAGVTTDVTTTITSNLEIFNVYIMDANGNELSPPSINVNVGASGGVYHVYIYCSEALSNVQLKIILSAQRTTANGWSPVRAKLEMRDSAAVTKAMIFDGATSGYTIVKVDATAANNTITLPSGTATGIELVYLSGSLTDGTPTDAQIDSVTGLTPAGAGAGYQCMIKDTNGTGLLYLIISDGTDWYYLVMTKAL
jgi:hypothetical protein